MHPTLRDIVGEPSLRLTLLGAGSDGALDGTVSWAHSSDLVDPTPFLDAGQVLLTTGTQFGTPTATYAEYAARLAAHGVAAIGFGTEVATTGTPDELVDACAAVGLPLFEVPYHVPFIAIGRYVADRVAAAEHERDSWALGAMRSISFAALRPDGLGATLAELARQLDRSVVLFDPAGSVTHAHDAGSRPLVPAMRAAVAEEASRLLERAQRSSSTMRLDGVTVHVQTIGRRSELRGVLAVAGEQDLDASDQTVVTSVVALVGVALEQGRALRSARSSVRSAAMRALLDGREDLASAVLRELGESLPAGELTLALVRGGATEELPGGEERRSAESAVLVARVDAETAILGAADAVDAALTPLLAGGTAAGRTRIRAGVSTAVARAEVDRARLEALAALAATRADAPVVHAAELARRGVDWLLESPGARETAASVLRPIAEDETLLSSLAAWLAANGQADPAARSMGVHRHTMRARITAIERLIDRDLSAFGGRAEVWIALRALRGRGTGDAPLR